MQVYNKEPIMVLWDAVKSLKNKIPIYKEAMDDDADSTPNSYLLLRSDVTNTSLLRGDGATQIRVADCDILLVSKGIAQNSTDVYNTNKAKVEAALKAAGLEYTGANLGYDSGLKSTQYVWSVSIAYV
jgi:hypothetical protein